MIHPHRNHSDGNLRPIPLPAFTLIELLTVIAVVAVLATILIPVGRKVHANATFSQCASNIRQKTLAYLINAGENEGVLHPAFDPDSPHRRWPLMLTGYNNAGEKIGPSYVPTLNATYKDDSPVIGCPVHRDHLNLRPSSPTYSSNRNVATGESKGWKRLSDFEHPARTMLLAEGTGTDGKISTILNSGQMPGHQDPHGGKINISFVDGHVESRELAEFPASSSTKREDRLLWFGGI